MNSKPNTDVPNRDLLRVPDTKVDCALDEELCQLLQMCFPKESKFTDRRYYNELPQMRWMIRVDEQLVAHIAAHDKAFEAASKTFRFCGLSEVCVVHACRGQGLLPQLLAAMEEYYSKRSYDFSVLLGPAKIYKPYGYRSVENVYFSEQSEDSSEFAMYKALGTESWPKEPVHIEGPYF